MRSKTLPALAGAVGLLALSTGAVAAGDWSGHLRGRFDSTSPSPTGPYAASRNLEPTVAPRLPDWSAGAETELRGRLKFASANVAWRNVKAESAQWRDELVVNELYASGSVAGLQLSAGRKIVAWDVGYAFRPNDVVQQEARRTLLSSTPQGRAVVQAEYFTAKSAWSLVWVNPQRSLDDEAKAPGMGASEEAVAGRFFHQLGSADLHLFARRGDHTKWSAGGAIAWVVSDSTEIHASGRIAEKADEWAAVSSAGGGLVTASPYGIVTRPRAGQALVGATWTGESKLSFMAEWWYDTTAPSNQEWDAWKARNVALGAVWSPGAPNGLRVPVAGNLAWQADLLKSPGIRRNNVFLRGSWDYENWRPSIDVLFMPADKGRVVTFLLGWQGDRVRLDGGWRYNAGPSDAIVRQTPTRRTAFVATTWSF